MSKRESHLYEFGPYRLIPQERLLLRDGEPVTLTPKAFETLVALVRRAGHLAEKDELLKEVWPDSFVEESNLAQNIHALRRALGEGENGKSYIETVPKRGYRFLASVRIVEDRAEELFIGQHIRAQTNPHLTVPPAPQSPQSGFATEEAAESQSKIAAPYRDVTALEESRQELQRVVAPNIRGRSRSSQIRNAAIVLVILIVVLGGGALLYKFARRANPSSPFQTMKHTRLTTSGKVFNAAISPDGNYVVYAAVEGSRQSLWIRQTGTQSQVQIVTPAEVTYTGLTFTPDSKYIYYSVVSRDFPDRALFQVPTLGGATKKVLENLRANPVSFSPDGRQFCFVRFAPGKESTLIIVNADGSGERKLFEHKASGTMRFPAWSPDGQRIAFVEEDYANNNCALFEVQVADGSTRPLTAQRWFRIVGLAWLSDGSGLIMLCGAAEERVVQIWRLPYPAGEAMRVTNDPRIYEWLSLTADSRTLAAVTFQTEANIWLAPVSDSGRARPVTSGSGIDETCVSWTPDGRIVYHSDASGTDDIWMMDADGSNRKQLTNNARINQCPVVSPDGGSIVFLSDRTGSPHLWRMNLDGGDQRQMTNGPGGEQNPQFSPDGRWIVYRTNLGKPTVWKLPASGGDPVQLTDKFSLAPTVSPDSRLVAYIFRNENDPLGIAIAPLEGGEPIKTFALPPSLPFVTFIRWTHDGRAFAYIETRDGVSNIIAQPIDGGQPVSLTDFREGRIFSFAFSPDGKQLALSRGATDRDVVLIKDFR
jgi:Tol biopolymer transport system component/DNA-binding winged helix-turn-helix (wHTH) protein